MLVIISHWCYASPINDLTVTHKKRPLDSVNNHKKTEFRFPLGKLLLVSIEKNFKTSGRSVPCRMRKKKENNIIPVSVN